MSKWQEPIAIALDDDRVVMLGPLRKSDRAALAKAAEELSARSRYYRFHTSGIRLVESGCGAVALGSAYLFPPLSSGGVSLAGP